MAGQGRPNVNTQHRSRQSAQAARAHRYAVMKKARARKVRARLLALPIFSVLAILTGLLVFSLLGTKKEEQQPITDVVVPTPTTSVVSALPTVTAPTTVLNDFPTYSSGSPNKNATGSAGKQKPPSAVSYASTTGETVSLSGKVDCENVILIDMAAGEIVASYNSGARIYPASLTKVMTLITAYDYINDPYTECFTMTQELLEPQITSGNSLAGFEVGESSPLIDYYYGLIMPSGADAAEGIAIYCSGSVDSFVTAMNRKAKEIGLQNSHFTNPIGAHDESHYSTVHDMALILGYAYKIDLLAKVLSTYQYTTTATDIHPQGLYFESNLQQRMKGDESKTCEVLGGKTGYTPEAGNCVVTYARSNKTGKYYLFAAAKGDAMYDPIWDCINTLKDYVE